MILHFNFIWRCEMWKDNNRFRRREEIARRKRGIWPFSWWGFVRNYNICKSSNLYGKLSIQYPKYSLVIDLQPKKWIVNPGFGRFSNGSIINVYCDFLILCIKWCRYITTTTSRGWLINLDKYKDLELNIWYLLGLNHN